MTLKQRNKLIKIIFAFSIVIAVGVCALFSAAFFMGRISPPEVTRLPSFIAKIPFLPYSFPASLISAAVFMIYVPFTLFYIIKFFESTQTSELIFFIPFLCGCLCESARLVIPLFGLWETFFDLLFALGRIIFFGRIFSVMSFVFASTTNTVEQRQNIERDLVILVLISIVCATVIPLNLAKISSVNSVVWGYSTLFAVIKVIFTVLAFLSYLIFAKKEDSEEFNVIAFSMLTTLAGHGLLGIADNYVFTVSGTILLISGTVKYLKTLHKLYMWK